MLQNVNCSSDKFWLPDQKFSEDVVDRMKKVCGDFHITQSRAFEMFLKDDLGKNQGDYYNYSVHSSFGTSFFINQNKQRNNQGF